MDKWFKDILPDKDPYHNRGRDQMRKKGGPEFECLSKLSIDLFFKLPVSRFLAINIEGKIGQLTVRRTSSFINSVEQLQTLPKTQSEIDISPFLKTQKPTQKKSISMKNSQFFGYLLYAKSK
jgi:hypothetical protein